MVVLAGPVLVCLGSAEMHKRYPAAPPTRGRQAMLPNLPHAIATVVRFHADRSAPFFPNAASDRARAHFAEGAVALADASAFDSGWPTRPGASAWGTAVSVSKTGRSGPAATGWRRNSRGQRRKHGGGRPIGRLVARRCFERSDCRSGQRTI